MKLRALLLIQILLLLTTSFSAQTKEDNLRKKLENDEITDSIKKTILKELITIESIDTSTVSDYSKLASLYYNDKDFLTAISYCDTALTYIPPVNKELRLKVQEKMAYIYRKMGETDRSIALYLNILSEYEDTGDLKESGRLNNLLGTTFKKLGEMDNAIYHLEESIEQSRTVSDTFTQASSLMTLGNCYKSLEQFPEAEESYLKSIELSESINNQRNIAGNYNNLGSLFRMKGDLKKAMFFYQKAVVINTETNNIKWLSYNYNNIGVIHENLNEYNKALFYYKKSLKIKGELQDHRGKLQTFISLSNTYEKIKDYKNALEYSQKGLNLKDSLYEADRVQETMILATEFQTEKRENEITKLNALDDLNKERIKSGEDRVKMLAVGILMLFLFIYIIWKSLQSRKKSNEILELKNNQIHTKNQLLDTKNKEITDSINYAKRFQVSILPSELEMNASFRNHAVLYQPKDIVSGDFYKFYATTNNLSYLAIADCTGHGVPGAMVSLIASSYITKAIKEERIEQPSEILNFINSEMPTAFESDDIKIDDGMDISLIQINKKEQLLTFSGANNNCWIINTESSFENRFPSDSKYKFYQQDDLGIIELKGNRFGIGQSTSNSKFNQTTISVKENDRIVMFTDGYVDQFGGPNNKKFKSIQLRNIFFDNKQKSPDEIKEVLSQTLKDWMLNYEQIDDICLFIADI